VSVMAENSGSINYVFVNENQDVWVVKGEPGGEVRTTVTRIEGVPDEVVAELEHEHWDISAELHAKLSTYPSVDL
jgi:hypothetical protein